MEKRWYIIQATSGFEGKIKKKIQDEIKEKNLDQYIEDIVIPTESVQEIRRGQKVISEKKFLPGYILVRAAMTDDVWHIIRAVPKVNKLLGGEGRPLPISDSEAERIFKQIKEGASVSEKTYSFDVGESVKVIDGPFDSFVGVVMDNDTDRCRLKVTVSIFGRSTPIELEYNQVQKI